MIYTLHVLSWDISYEPSKIQNTVVDSVPPFHPIVSAIETPTYKLAKTFVLLLEPLPRNHHTIKPKILLCSAKNLKTLIRF